MTLVSFPIQVQVILGIVFSLPLIFTSSNVKCEVFDSNVPNSPRENPNQYADHLVNQIVKRRCRKRVRILFSTFLSGLLLLLTFASEVKAKRLIPGFVFFPFKSEDASKTRSRTTMSAGRRNLNGYNNNNINNNQKNAVSIWHEKERLYKGLVEETNLCSLCNNRKECESIIQDYEANQMLSEWKDIRGAQDEAIQLGDDNDNGNNVDEVEKRQEGKVKAETIWVPLLNIRYIKPGDLLPIDLDLDDLGIELESETAIDNVKTLKKHLLLAVGDSPLVEEELSIIDNVSPILMLPTNIYDITNQYQNLKAEREDTEEDDGNKMNIACGMKEGRGKFRSKTLKLEANGSRYRDRVEREEETKETSESENQNNIHYQRNLLNKNKRPSYPRSNHLNNHNKGKQRRNRNQDISFTDNEVKSIMYNGKEYFYFEEEDEDCSWNDDYVLLRTDADTHTHTDKSHERGINILMEGLDDGSRTQHPFETKNTQMKKNLNFNEEEEYLDVDGQQNKSKESNENQSFIDNQGKNSLLPLFPSLHLGPFINRVTSKVDFNKRIKNSKDNDFLAKINSYNIRINDKNILEICLGKGKYRY